MGVYEAEDDSKLLLNCAKEYLTKTNKEEQLDILEIGVGSGFVLSELAKEFPLHKYFGSDINKDALQSTKQLFQKNKQKVTLKQSNLFEKWKKNKFDLILFNTPYLPLEDEENFEELSMEDKALYGGKEGNEVTLDFLKALPSHLKEKGKTLIITSSLAKPERIEQRAKELLLETKIIKTSPSFFEEILCIDIKKTYLLEKLSKQEITEIDYFSKGKKSQVYKGKFHKKDIIIKLGKEDDLQVEKIFLKKLEHTKFTPKLIGKQYSGAILMSYVKGENIEQFLKNNTNKKEISQILNSCLAHCYTLDSLKITKKEMTNPYKHIIIDDKANVTFIDFERALYNDNPKNTRQFLQYLCRQSKNLQKKGIVLDTDKIREQAKAHKEKPQKIRLQTFLENKIT